MQKGIYIAISIIVKAVVYHMVLNSMVCYGGGRCKRSSAGRHRNYAQGRFCLNDLHRAAGGFSKDQPSKFLILDTTKEMIKEIEAGKLVSEQFQAVTKIQGGNGWQGTFVCKELVYAYAMWISPSFSSRVAELEIDGIPFIESKQGG